MKVKYGALALFVLVFVSCQSGGTRAPTRAKAPDPISLAGIFQDGMVVQRDAPLALWGRGEPGRSIDISFGESRGKAVVGAEGTWSAELEAPRLAARDANQGRELLLSYDPKAGSELRLSDILVGDIWLCSGQSNMEFGIANMEGAEKVLADAELPGIRLFLIPKAGSGLPRLDLSGAWVGCDRESLLQGGWGGFSAVASVFALKIYRETGIPQGIIQAAFGGAPISAFIPPEEILGVKELTRSRAEYNKARKAYEAALKDNPNAAHPWADSSDYSKLKPTMAYNAMIYPIAPLRIKGVLWYQGESNVGTGALYTQEMRALISGWRRAFLSDKLGFYFAQVAPWKYGGSLPSMWDSQIAVLDTEGVGMALTIDLGDSADIHPKRKIEVGERLALQALHGSYARSDIDPDGPVLAEARLQGDQLELSYAHAEGGLFTTDSQAPVGFEICGADRKWQRAQAEIRGQTIMVKAESIKDVFGLRYAYEDCPRVNLVDKDGLPARPFSMTLAQP